MRFLFRSAKRPLRMAQHGFTVAGVLALGYCLTVFVEAALFQDKAARDFASEPRPSMDRAATPSRLVTAEAVTKNGGVIGRIEVPRIGLSVIVVEGVDDGDLKLAAGHIPGTALPGEPGNVGIAGHRDTFFRPLRSIRRYDTIILRSLQGAYRYRVVAMKVVLPEDVAVLYPTGRDSLTLVTCFPFDYVGSAPKRFIVRAERMPGT
jgi:sortase A